jgi:hypothetical protein
MASHHYDKALMFATTPDQKSSALNKKTTHDARCEKLRIRAVEAESNSKHRGGQLQHASEAASAQYASECN